MSTRLIELMETLPAARVVLLGDFMLDRYLYGNAERLSPEAPVPVLHFQKEELRLGGAGSVAANLAELGAKVAVIGVVGEDGAGSDVRKLLRAVGVDDGGLLVDERPTTCKMRLVGSAQHRHPQQMIRLDYEHVEPIDDIIEARLLDRLKITLAGADLLCIEDYGKGVITESLCQQAIALATSLGKPTLIDPARIDDYARYTGAACLKLNRPEASRATELPIETPQQVELAAAKLLSMLSLESVVITLDKQGAYLAEQDGNRRMISTRARQVFDVTGAGDMAFAMLAVARAAGASWADATTLANVAGGLEVEKFGVVPITRREIIADLLAEGHEHAGKQRTLEQLLPELQRHRELGKKIVFTNGCFDLIHLGHVKYFQYARKQGDLLVVGINTDASIQRLKGDKRPIISEADRASVLEELQSIDYLLTFDDDTPIRLIEQIRPDVLVKGADYTKEQVVGWDVVERAGGRVALAPLIDGRSTSAVIQRVLAAYG